MGDTEREELKIEKGGSKNNHTLNVCRKHFKLKPSKKKKKKNEKRR